MLLAHLVLICEEADSSHAAYLEYFKAVDREVRETQGTIDLQDLLRAMAVIDKIMRPRIPLMPQQE